MRIRILGGGWYGCHLARALLKRGHEVQLHEISDHLFAGASGGNPARLHLGFHYPRSHLTRAMCQDTHREFMLCYGGLTRTIPVNIYAIAADRSQVDWGNYKQTLRGEVDYIELESPEELGLRNVEGAMLTGERHIVIRKAREFFERELRGHVYFEIDHRDYTPIAPGFDWTIDCTFCARDAERIDRYEVCVTGLLKGPPFMDGRAVTIMDGPFPSIYPWDQEAGLWSITSAALTPIHRAASYLEAHTVLRQVTQVDARAQVEKMREQMAHFWPDSMDLFAPAADPLVRIRAMPLSGADARLVDVVRTDERSLRIRAGKIDAIMFAERQVVQMIEGGPVGWWSQQAAIRGEARR